MARLSSMALQHTHRQSVPRLRRSISLAGVPPSHGRVEVVDASGSVAESRIYEELHVGGILNPVPRGD